MSINYINDAREAPRPGVYSTNILVIGSGFSGSIAAKRLVDAGNEGVTLLERGPWRKTLPVQSMGVSETAQLPQGIGLITRLMRTVHHKYLPKDGLQINRKGLLEFGRYTGVTTLCGSGVGGGSHIYGGLLERSPDSHYWDSICSDLSEEKLQPHHDYVSNLLKPVRPTISDKVPNCTPATFSDSTIFSATEEQQPAMGVYFPSNMNQQECSPSINRLPTDFTGDSVFGSPVGSKTSVDFAVLNSALEQGLRLLSMCEVLNVSAEEEGYLAEVKNWHSKSTFMIAAKKVVLAAGTMNTLKLLLRSRDKLAPMPALGMGFGTNGDYAAYWRCQDEGKDYSKGTPCHGRVSLKDIEECPDLILANIGVPISYAWFMPRLLTRVLEKTRKDLMVIGMGPDAADGAFTYNNRRMDVEYEPGNSPIFQRIRECFKVIEARSGRRMYYSNKAATVHQFGGARIGTSEAEGVVSASGEVFNNPGLYIVDASCLPKAVGGPPTMTVAAWASYVSEGISSPTPLCATSFSVDALVGLRMKELDQVFSMLPLANGKALQGAYLGSLMMVKGLSWLPFFVRKLLLKFVESMLFSGWKGKFFSEEGGYNLFENTTWNDRVLPFKVSRSLAADGSGLAFQLNYNIPTNKQKHRKIRGEARMLNERQVLARMYYDGKKILYYILNQK